MKTKELKTKPAVLVIVGVVALFQAAAILAQNNRGSGQRSTQNVTYQTATTKSGRTVILKSDRTWVYADGDPTSEVPNDSSTSVPGATTKSAAARGNSTLSIDSGVVLQSGEVLPLARTSFLLLDDDLASILKKANFGPSANVGGFASLGYGITAGNILSTFALSWRYETLGADKETYQRAISIIRPHVRANVDSDFKGRAKLTGVPPGVYHVACWYWHHNQAMVWSVKTNLKAGANSIVIDQNNAALVGGG